MKRLLRIGLASAAVVAGIGIAGGSTASAQVAFQGHFRLPHGSLSIGFGSPFHRVGSYAPYGHRVYSRPRYGYGFDSPAFYCRSHGARHSHWVPVRRHHRRWVIVERPTFVVQNRIHRGRDYGYRRHDGRHHRRDGRRYDDRYGDSNRRDDYGRRYCDDD